jgi:hypothetical protein
MSYFDAIAKSLGSDNPTSRPDPVENRDCFERAVKGSEEDIQKFIINNMRLVSSVVQRFIGHRKRAIYLEEDMFSEGLLVLTKSIRTLIKTLNKDDEKLQAALLSFVTEVEGFNVIMYIYISVYRAVQELYEKDSSDYISERMIERHTPSGQNKPVKKVDVGEGFFEGLIDDPFNEIFFMELLKDVCESEEECFVLDKLLEGFYEREIAEELGCDRPKISRMKTKIYRQFCVKNHFGEGNRAYAKKIS